MTEGKKDCAEDNKSCLRYTQETYFPPGDHTPEWVPIDANKLGKFKLTEAPFDGWSWSTSIECECGGLIEVYACDEPVATGVACSGCENTYRVEHLTEAPE